MQTYIHPIKIGDVKANKSWPIKEHHELQSLFLNFASISKKQIFSSKISNKISDKYLKKMILSTFRFTFSRKKIKL